MCVCNKEVKNFTMLSLSSSEIQWDTILLLMEKQDLYPALNHSPNKEFGRMYVHQNLNNSHDLSGSN